MRNRNWAVVACLLSSTLIVFPLASQAKIKASPKQGHWVNTWVSMPQLTEASNLPPDPFTRMPTADTAAAAFVNTTLRQTIHTSVGGKQIRVTFSNTFGATPFTITSAKVALPAGGAAGVSAIQPGTEKSLTFQKQTSVTITAGAQVVSDPLDYELAPMSNLTVTIYLAEGQVAATIDTTSDPKKVPVVNVTSHPGSRTTSWMVFGDHLSDVDLGGLSGVANTNHWYFLSGIEVWADKFTSAIVIFGDSLADGRGSTNNGNDRWPDQMLSRLQANPSTANIAVLNQAAGGNAVLSGGLGPIGLSRLDRDVFGQSGVRWMIVCNGINDIGNSPATEEGQKKIAADLISAYDQIIRRAHAHNIIVYAATLTPMGGHSYFDSTGYHEAARQTVNAWIRTSGRFDGVFDFDAAVRDPSDPTRNLDALVYKPLNPDGTIAYVDALHFNPTGYKVIADTVQPLLFWQHWFPSVEWHFDDDGTKK